MAFLVRCPCCAAPKRVDPDHWWTPTRVECPRCASMFEAGVREPWFVGTWVRFLGPSPTQLEARFRLVTENVAVRFDLDLDGAGDLVHRPLVFSSLVA